MNSQSYKADKIHYATNSASDVSIGL